MMHASDPNEGIVTSTLRDLRESMDRRLGRTVFSKYIFH